MTGRYKALLALLLFAGSCQLSAKTYILCVGIQNYPGTENDVFLCAKDAKTVKWLFQKNGNAESVLLTNSEATRGNILTAFEALAAACGPDDALAIFYSGHGGPGVLDTYDHELDYRQLCDLFGKSRARYKFAFINACFSGTMRKEYNEGVMIGQGLDFFKPEEPKDFTIGRLSPITLFSRKAKGIMCNFTTFKLKGCTYPLA